MSNAAIYNKERVLTGAPRCVTVEPTPELANILRNSSRLNVHEVAVNQHGQSVLFKIDKINSEVSTIVTTKDDDAIIVSGVKLDDLLKENSGIDLIN